MSRPRVPRSVVQQLAALFARNGYVRRPSAKSSALVNEGQQLQGKTQAAAQARLEALSQATEQVTEQVAGMANEFSDKATGQWNKLENLFENRVATALMNLGIPSAPDIVALQARIQALEEHIAQMHALASPAKTRAKAPRAAPSPKSKTPTARARKT